MKQWRVGFSKVCEQDIDVSAGTEAEAIIKAYKKWHIENPNTPEIKFTIVLTESEKNQ